MHFILSIKLDANVILIGEQLVMRNFESLFKQQYCLNDSNPLVNGHYITEIEGSLKQKA